MAKKTKTLHQWECPHKEVFLLKPEAILLAVFVLLIFVFSFAVFNQRWLPAIILTLFFILIFSFITQLLRKFYPLKETYQITHSGISIKSQSPKKTTKINIKFKDIKNFKLDKFFHGGRIETKTKRHPLFFNAKEEILKLEKILKKKVSI